VRERFRAATLVDAELETGRTHQIRVHLASIGHPLVGDRRYGARGRLPPRPTETLVAAVRAFRRQALHAVALGFAHPRDGRWLEFASPLPADFEALLAALREDRDAA
jgi:23S rRNA pseudouridine1911/1915/1917 synthase